MTRFRLERGPVPLHHQVYLDLRAALAANEWKLGERLPTERELAARYGCSLITVRRALDDLTREGRLERTVPLVFSLDETCDVGHDGGLPVSDDYRAEDSEFTGTVESVLIELSEGFEDFNHLIDPQLRLSVAIARQ